MISKINVRSRRVILIGIAFVAIVFLGSRIISGRTSRNQATPIPQGSESFQNLDKEFSFPVDKGINIKFVIQSASLSRQIVVQGQNAVAAPGRTFLILTLKIVNDYNQSIQINTRDYVRLSVNGNENEWLAPDIHNDPVEVQAISTKYTRVGFPVNVGDRKFVLQVGEIKGDKQKVPLNL